MSATPLTTSHWVPDGSGPPLRLDLTVGDLLREVASAVPDRIALVEGLPDPGARRRWTYAELMADAERCARMLLRRFQPGERIAIWAHNLPEWMVVEYGAALAGITLVTVNPSLQPAEVSYVLAQSQAVGILLVPDVRGNPLAAHLDGVRADLPDLREVLRLDQLGELLTEADPGGPAADVELPSVAGDDIVQIQYTSGTTGLPKGAMLRHAGVVNNAGCWADRVGIPDVARWLTPMPLFHTGGCVLAVLGALSRRATLVLMPGFDPGLALELIESESPWFFAGVPTMLIAMLDHPDLATRDLSSVHGILSGGAQVPEALVRRIEDELGVDFTIVYGQTECSPALTNTSPTDSPRDKGLTVGPPLPHTEIRIVDPGTLETVPPGTAGEMWARGYFTMAGYNNNPDATAEALLDDGWLRTGDLAVMDERGYCSIVGRLKDMIIRGGENLFPVEIEEILHRHPGVADVAVVGIPDEKWGEVVAAFVRPTDSGQVPTIAELRDHARTHLSPQKTPTLWYYVDEFPLTGSGKIQKNMIRDRWQEGSYQRNYRPEPSSAVDVVGAVAAPAGQRHVIGIETETQCRGRATCSVIQQIGGSIDDGVATPAHQVEMVGGLLSGEVVGRRAVGQVDMVDHAEVNQGVECSVDGGPMDVGFDFGQFVDDVVRAEMVTGRGQHVDDGPPRRGDPLTTGAQHRQRGIGGTLSGGGAGFRGAG